MSISLPPLLPPLPLPFFFQTFLLGSHYIAHTVVLPQPSALLDYRCSLYYLTLSCVCKYCFGGKHSYLHMVPVDFHSTKAEWNSCMTLCVLSSLGKGT